MIGYKNTALESAPDIAKERLCALWDHELSELEARRYKDALQLGADERATLARYALIGEALRQADARPLVGPGFLASLNARLDAEAAQDEVVQTQISISSHSKNTASFGRLLLGSAIAASVAMLVVTGMSRYQDMGQEAAPLVAEASGPAPMTLVATSQVPVVGTTDAKALSPEMERKLNRYLVSHGEYARGQGMGQMLPYASLVSYGAKR